MRQTLLIRTPFDQLTNRGKAQRLRPLAHEVLKADYALTPDRLRLVAMHSFNSVFRVDGADTRLAMRIGADVRIHTPAVEDIEAAWLDGLHDAGIAAPRNVATTQSHRWTSADYDGVPAERVCTLFTWRDGTRLNAHPTADALRLAGRLFAQLHEHATSFDTSALNVAAIETDRAIYLPNDNLVASYESPHGTLFNEATDRVQESIDTLWKSPPHHPHLLHGDFGPHNVLVHRGHPCAIDFQDMQFGFAVQDLAISVTDLRRSQPHLIEPMLAGYRDVRALPELGGGLLDSFAAQRSLNIMNLALHAPATPIAAALPTHAERVAAWMTSSS